MTDVYRFSEPQLLLFFMVLVRLTAFVVSWPVFGVETVSQPVKILFALVLAMVVFPTLTLSSAQYAAVKSDLILLTMREAAIGLMIGFLARMFFFAFRVAGEMISQAMGLSSAQLFNPFMGGQTTAVEQFYVALATLFYLAVNGHHLLIMGLVRSFDMAPVAQLSFNMSQFGGVSALGLQVLEIGLRLSAPVVISILVVNLILGLVGKTVPQLNVLVTSFAINIMVGFFLMLLTLPMLVDQMGGYLETTTAQIFALVKTL